MVNNNNLNKHAVYGQLILKQSVLLSRLRLGLDRYQNLPIPPIPIL